MRLNKLLMASVAGALLMQAPTAFAQTDGPFIGLSGGVNWLEDADIGGGTLATTSTESDNGWLALGTLGYRYGNGFRTELEFGYRENDVDKVFGAGSGAGDITAKSFLLNVLYDFRSNSRLMPYIGGGLGYAEVEYDGLGPLDADLDGLGPDIVDSVSDEDGVFAYQAIAGISYWMSDSVELSTEYHYMAAQDPELTTAAGVGVDAEYQSHAVLVGLRWNFGGPAQAAQPMQAAAVQEPAPAPMAPAEPAELPRNFLVFFDWDKSDITPEAAVILKDAADYAKANGATRITATGHADRSGSDEYNMALSMRRAEAIKRQLIANGIGESDIGLDARGESDPLVPTEDGVREPQNRRVEIVLQ